MARYRKDRKIWEARKRIAGEQRSFYSKLSAAEAEQKASAALAEWHDAPTLVTDRTFGGFIALHIAPLYAGKDKRQVAHARLFLRIIIDAIGHIPLSQLQPSDLQALMHRYSKTHLHGSCANLKKYMSKTCRIAARMGKIHYNYAEEVTFRAPKKMKYVPSVPEALWLLEVHRGHHWEAQFFLEFVLGLRRDEAASVTVDDISSTELLVRGTKTDGAYRVIPLPKPIAGYLLSIAQTKARYLATGLTGCKLRNNWSDMLDEAYAWACLPRGDHHCLRHAFGAIESEVGAPRAVRLAILGQSKRTVADLYQHAEAELIRESLSKWWEYLQKLRAECLPELEGTPRVRLCDEPVRA